MPHINRVRERVSWKPVWGKVYEGYAANFYRSNIWRCDRLHELSDLIQDAYVIFAKVRDTYPRVIEEKHFMALFKRALTNNMHDKASYRRRKDAVEVYLSSDVGEFFAGRIGELGNSGYLAALINEMPEELRQVLNLMADGLRSEPATPRQRGMQPREGLSMQLRRLLRLPINSDPLVILRNLITQ